MTKVLIPFSPSKFNSVKKDFDLIVNGKKFPICSLIASRNSRFLFNLFIEDPAASQIEISLPNGDFSPVCEYLNTENIKISPENYLYLLHASNILQSDDLQSRVLSSCDLTSNEALDLIIEAFQNDMDCKKFGNVIGSKLGLLLKDEHDKMKSLSPEILEIILQSNYQNVDPFVLKEFLLEKAKETKDPNFRLIPYYPFPVFKQDEIRNLLKTPKFNINQIRSVLIKRSQGTEIKVNASLVYIPIEGKELDGIIHLFYKPLIKASSVYSDKYKPEILLENPSKDPNAYYCSETGPEVTLDFDFEKRPITLEKYALRSWSGASNQVAPQSWKLLGFDEEKNDWVTLHSVENNTSLCEDSKIQIFTIDAEPKPYSQFRFQQIRCCNARNRVLALSGIEFFGKVRQI